MVTSRIIDRPVPVEVDAAGRPLALILRGRLRVAAVLDCWTESGEWWDGEGERLVWRVQTDRGGVCELECRDGQWRLYKEYD